MRSPCGRWRNCTTLGVSRGAVVALVAASLGGCVSDGVGPRETIGALAGAVGGAAVAAGNIGKGTGRDFAAGAGALLGAVVGADIGRSLDRSNAAYRSPARGPAGHSQQVPVPGFAPSAGGGWGARGESANESERYEIRDAHECRPLDDKLRPTFVCHTVKGHWFVIQ